MNKTYKELRQAAYMRAARELVKVATMVLEDVREPLELTGQTHEWAKNLARETMEKAYELEQKGYDECYLSGAVRAPMTRARAAFSDAVTAYQQRRHAAYEALALERVG